MLKKILLTLAALITAGAVQSAATQVTRIEPPNWWVGMKSPALQLMVHGERIAELSPSLRYPGVRLLGVQKTDNPNYLFINLQISPQAKPGTVPLVFSRQGVAEVKASYALLPRRAGSAQRQGFGSKDAIYLIVPDRFANGDAANDVQPGMGDMTDRSIPTARHGGDLKGMTDHLDYIRDMGFTMVWPTPLTENKQPQYSYHGYALTDYYQVDPRFGSNADFKAYVAAAKQRGLGVIQDIVVNHIGAGHWWMKDMPSADWINFQKQGYVPTNNRHITAQDPHAAAADRQLFLDGWFDTQMPDMNQRNPLVARYLIQNTLWWIEYADLAGIREDTYPYADPQFLKRWSDTVMDEYPRLNIVGEEMHLNSAVLAYWQKGKHNQDGYQSGLPSLMDFPISDTMPAILQEADGWDTGLGRLYELIAGDFVYPDPMNLMMMPDNHDRSRIFSVLKEDLDLWKTLMIFNTTTRGYPQIFYGTEVLMKSPVVRDDGLLRGDFPGGWPGDLVNTFTGEGLSADQKDAQQTLRKLLNWRKGNSAVTGGKLTHYIPEGCHYVYFRHDDKKAAMVVMNKCKTDSTLNLARFVSSLQGKTQGRNVLTGDTVGLQQPLLLLRAKQSVVLDLLP
ncbi:MAG: alpha-amlyase [Burkholderiales bacterium PBB3]|nr:MAG: alpha-amlyase [Burkholderiales bacterium PBB3]